MLLAASPSLAAVNVINNGSFEAGPVGFAELPGWTRLNTPDRVPSNDQPGTVIAYGAGSSWPTGAYGEAVAAPTGRSSSPDAAGAKGYYFVSDFSNNETITQLTRLSRGNYRIGFDYYLPRNGLNNRNDASISATIIGVPVVSARITAGALGRQWQTVSGVAHIAVSGWYDTSFVFSAFGQPAKDIIIDRVFAIGTTAAPTTEIPPTPVEGVPEPEVWAMLAIGFAMVGSTLRRREFAAA